MKTTESTGGDDGFLMPDRPVSDPSLHTPIFFGAKAAPLVPWFQGNNSMPDGYESYRRGLRDGTVGDWKATLAERFRRVETDSPEGELRAVLRGVAATDTEEGAFLKDQGIGVAAELLKQGLLIPGFSVTSIVALFKPTQDPEVAPREFWESHNETGGSHPGWSKATRWAKVYEYVVAMKRWRDHLVSASDRNHNGESGP